MPEINARIALSRPGIKFCSSLSTGVSSESGKSSAAGKQCLGLYSSSITRKTIQFYVDSSKSLVGLTDTKSAFQVGAFQANRLYYDLDLKRLWIDAYSANAHGSANAGMTPFAGNAFP